MTQPEPFIRQRANNREINQILGNVPGPRTGQTVVKGVNPEMVTCDTLMVRKNIMLYGNMSTRFTVIGGDASSPAIGFVPGGANTGFFSPMPDKICVSIAGVPITCFTPTGLAVQNLYSPTGIINFGGSTLTNFFMSPNPNAYTLVGAQVQTAPTATANSLSVPLPCTVGVAAWELISKTEYTADVLTGASDNGVYTFHIRAWRTVPGPLNITAQFDITKHHTPSFVGTHIVAVVVGNDVQIRVTSNSTQTINWLTKCEVIKVSGTT